MKLSIIVPVYNEEKTLAEVIGRIQRVALDKEIIIVDDGSTDTSDRIIASLASPEIVKLRHPKNQGKGAAVRSALKHLRGDLVIIQDADLEYDPRDYLRLVAALEKGKEEVVYGSRFAGKRKTFALYALANYFLTRLTNLLYRAQLSDMETCYKLFRREVIEQLELESESFDFEPEITAKLLRLGYRIKEVSISYERRGYGEGKKIGFRDGVRAIITLLKYRRWRPKECKPRAISPKILHIITRLIIGGAQENTLFTVEGLAKRYGLEVTLVSGPPLGLEGSLLEDADRRGVKVVILPSLRRSLNPFYDILAFCQLFGIIRKGRFDIVHTHSSKAGILGRLAARLAGVKIIIHTIHGIPFHKAQSALPQYFYRLAERLVAPFTTRFITVAEAMKEQAMAAGLGSEDKFVTIHSGIELERFSSLPSSGGLRQKLGIKSGEAVVGKIARLFYLKGHSYFFGAAARVLEVFPQTRFLLVGEGILRRQFEREVEERGIADKVIFAGLVSPAEIPRYLALMDVLVHTSLWEGLPRSVVEAFAAGVPVVAFDTDGTREVVKEGENGHLVPAGDEKTLAEGIIDLLRDPPRSRRWAEQGKKLVEAEFGKDLMVDKIFRLYQEDMR